MADEIQPTSSVDLWHGRVRMLHQQCIDGLANEKYSELHLPFILQEWTKEDAMNWHHLVDGLSPPGRVYLKKLSMKMRQENAVAAIFQSDARRILPEKFSNHFHLTDPIGSDEWDEARQDIVRAHGGSYGNLPRNTWEDVIHTGVKGPCIQALSIATTYRGGDDDQVVVMDTTEFVESDKVITRWYMLPDWWNSTATRI